MNNELAVKEEPEGDTNARDGLMAFIGRGSGDDPMVASTEFK